MCWDWGCGWGWAVTTSYNMNSVTAHEGSLNTQDEQIVDLEYLFRKIKSFVQNQSIAVVQSKIATFYELGYKVTNKSDGCRYKTYSLVKVSRTYL